VNVAELFGLLGIKTDTRSFLAAADALRRLKEQAASATATAELSQAIAGVAGDSKKAAALIGVGYDELELKQARAKRQAEAWGKVTQAGARAARFAVYALGAAVGAIYSIGRAGSLGDEYTGVASKIRGLTDDVAQQKELQDQLFRSAQDTATGYGDVGGLYQQDGVAAQTSGRSLEQAAVIVDTISKAIKASGAPAEGARSALTQLAQALGSGKLRGEEFNSVIEQAPFLIDIVATSLGKTRGEMRKLAEAGQLTATVVLKALEQQKGAVDDAFAKRLPQVGDMFVRLRNTISKELAAAFADKNVANGLSEAFGRLASILVTVVRATAAIGSFFGEYPTLFKVLIVAVAALEAAFIAESIAATVAWIATLGPLAAGVMLVTAIAVAVIGLAIIFRRQLGRAVEWVGRVIDKVGDAFLALPGMLRRGVQAVLNWAEAKLQAAWNWAERVAKKVKETIVDKPIKFVKGAVDDVAGALGGVFGAGVSAAARVGGGGTVITQTVNQTNNINGGDPAAVTEAAKRGTVDALGEHARQAAATKPARIR